MGLLGTLCEALRGLCPIKRWHCEDHCRTRALGTLRLIEPQWSSMIVLLMSSPSRAPGMTHLLGLVNDLIAVASERIELTRQETDVAVLLADAVASARGRAVDSGIELILIAERPLIAQVDPVRSPGTPESPRQCDQVLPRRRNGHGPGTQIRPAPCVLGRRHRRGHERRGAGAGLHQVLPLGPFPRNSRGVSSHLTSRSQQAEVMKPSAPCSFQLKCPIYAHHDRQTTISLYARRVSDFCRSKVTWSQSAYCRKQAESVGSLGS